MDRIKRLSMQAIDRYGSKFTSDFGENKKVLDEVSIIRSKGLKNEIAGYITKYVKQEKSSKEIAEEEEVEVEAEDVADESVEETAEESAEAADEAVVEMAEEPEEIEIAEESS